MPEYDFDGKQLALPYVANLTSRGLVRTSGTLVRAEELGIVLVVLSLWAAAIALFINRWGKIRLMEPYHPYIETEATPNAAQVQNNGVLASGQRASFSHQVRALGHTRNVLLNYSYLKKVFELTHTQHGSV